MGTQTSVTLLSFLGIVTSTHVLANILNRDACMAKILEGHDKDWSFFLKYLPSQHTLKFLVSLMGSPKNAVFYLFLGMGRKAGVSLEFGPHLLACFLDPV